MGLSSRHHGEPGGLTEELDLAALLAVTMKLIPVLMAIFASFIVAVQPISLPKFGGGGGGGQKVLNLAVIVTGDQLLLKIQGGPEAQEIPLKKKAYKYCPDRSVSCQSCGGAEVDGYDYPGLYTQISKLKERPEFASVDTINIGAEDGIPWKVIARTIDAVRVKLEEPAYEDLCSYERAKPMKATIQDEDGKDVVSTVPNFPKIVFVML